MGEIVRELVVEWIMPVMLILFLFAVGIRIMESIIRNSKKIYYYFWRKADPQPSPFEEEFDGDEDVEVEAELDASLVEKEKTDYCPHCGKPVTIDIVVTVTPQYPESQTHIAEIKK